VAIVFAALPLLAATAAADQYFHTTHAELTPIGAAPLQSGFVNDIHSNGPTISAQERYQLYGAKPSTTYSVALHLSFVDPTCTAVNAVFNSTSFTTNATGNGHGDFTFYAANPAPPPNPRQVYIRWVVSSGGVPQYQTDCVPVVIGA
jgi:hypothetical protein